MTRRVFEGDHTEGGGDLGDDFGGEETVPRANERLDRGAHLGAGSGKYAADYGWQVGGKMVDKGAADILAD